MADNNSRHDFELYIYMYVYIERGMQLLSQGVMAYNIQIL